MAKDDDIIFIECVLVTIVPLLKFIIAFVSHLGALSEMKYDTY